MDSFSFGDLLYTAARLEREREASTRTWLRRLRAIERRERQATPKERTVIVNKPAHLAGVHKL